MVDVVVLYVLLLHRQTVVIELSIKNQRQAFVQLNFKVELCMRFSFIWLGCTCINELC